MPAFFIEGWHQLETMANQRQPRQQTIAEPATPIAAEETPKLASTVPDEVLIKRYKGNGIQYCEKCIRPLQTGVYGEPVCAIGQSDCDRLKV
jgi:hypothetical protein